MSIKNSITEGNILKSLIGFALPVLAALFLQSLYGGVDLLIVGQFAETADVSGVATGSTLMHTITMIVTGLAMGITVLVAQRIGEKNPEKAGEVIGTGICLFAVCALIMTILLVLLTELLAVLMHAPKEAFDETVIYLRLCGLGSIFIVAYNVLGAVFRGIGDSKTPLMTVCIACVLNIAGDLLLVAVLGLGASGAALATIISQAASVVISLIIISKRKLPFTFNKSYIKFDGNLIKYELKLGIPIALQELLVGFSFLIIQAIANSIDVTSSAGVGVAEKVCAFIMLVPSAYMQSMAAFVAQNMGARRPKRAKKALLYGIMTSFLIGCIIGAFTFVKGDLLASVFSNDGTVILAAHDYLKAYAIDCLLVAVMFCMVGFFNGLGETVFVMIQGIIGALGVRVPVVLFMSSFPDTSLFLIGLGTPASTFVQIILCVGFMYFLKRKGKLD
ncbi:MAG: MATE family efflux transporter [Firmicutes bacterium]|nr:MATE family efflux transporter [Bacillota bacterium]